jgi:hypothetical protein
MKKIARVASKQISPTGLIASLKPHELLIFKDNIKPLRKHRQSVSQFINSHRKTSVH